MNEKIRNALKQDCIIDIMTTEYFLKNPGQLPSVLWTSPPQRGKGRKGYFGGIKNIYPKILRRYL